MLNIYIFFIIIFKNLNIFLNAYHCFRNSSNSATSSVSIDYSNSYDPNYNNKSNEITLNSEEVVTLFKIIIIIYYEF